MPASGGLYSLAQIDGRAILVASDGTYLGLISSNRYSSDSICNRYGDYGSRYASLSIRNQYGDYGSRYASDSAYNPYSFSPPAIVLDGTVVGYVTKSSAKLGGVDPDVLFAAYDCVYD